MLRILDAAMIVVQEQNRELGHKLAMDKVSMNGVGCTLLRSKDTHTWEVSMDGRVHQHPFFIKRATMEDSHAQLTCRQILV